MKRASQSDWQADAFIRAALAPFGAKPTDLQCARIRTYIGLLLKWNEKVNLTAITSPQEILTRHFGESAFALSQISPGTMVDIGSGAGFPGLVLKLFNPELDVTLIEPVLKKAAFLKEAARALEVSAHVSSMRIEEMEFPGESLETVTIRAVRLDDPLLELIAPSLRAGGKFIAWVGAGDATVLQRKQGLDWMVVQMPRSDARVLLIGKKG